MATFVYPTVAELSQIAQVKMPVLTMDDPLFQIMPIKTYNTTLVMWDQRDNYLGLQQLRGVNGAPSKVQMIGGKRYQERPGIYGEYIPLDEQMLLERGKWGAFGQGIDISDIVREAQDQLLNRRIDRIRYIGWTLLTTGTFSVSLPNYGGTGGVAHTGSYTLQTYSRAVSWATSATATPLADLRGVQLLARGYGVNLGRQATAYMNRKTFNYLMSNTNSADLGGRRLTGLQPVNNIGELNQVLTGDDLPNIVIYDEGYFDDSATFQLFIPDNKVVIVGQRPAGQTIAEYMMVRNVENANFEAGPYTKVVDTFDTGQVPREIKVHDGHNGGPAIYFPGSVVVLST